MAKIGNVLVGAASAFLLVIVVLQARSEPVVLGAEPLYALALTAESEGETAKAQSLFQQAMDGDRGSLPRWTMANFYLRHEDERAWPLLSEALQIALHGNQDVSGIFEVGWQYRPDASFLLGNLIGANEDAIKAYVVFLLNTGRVQALPAPASKITDRTLLLRASDALLTAGEVQQAHVIWTRMYPASSSGELLTNVELRRPTLLGFDWRYNTSPDIPIRFQEGLQIDFNGRQPDPLELMMQTVPVMAGNYRLAWESKASRDAGISWKAMDAKSGALVFRSQIHSSEIWQSGTAEFNVLNPGAIRLVLLAERLPGTSRFEGNFRLKNPSLRAR